MEYANERYQLLNLQNASQRKELECLREKSIQFTSSLAQGQSTINALTQDLLSAKVSLSVSLSVCLSAVLITALENCPDILKVDWEMYVLEFVVCIFVLTLDSFILILSGEAHRQSVSGYIENYF